MARNESIAAVPADISDRDTLKRFLDRLVEQLDIVLGFRGGDPYVSTDDQVRTLSELQSLLSELKETNAEVASTIEEFQRKLDEIKQTLEELSKLKEYQDTSIRDLNDTAWTSASVYSSFTAIGSDIINPPTPLAAGDTYKCFVEVRPSFVQRVTIAKVGAVSAVTDKVRAGASWSELIANAWV